MREEAREVPTGYAPPLFTSAALQRTHVRLTWDEEDEARKRALTKKITADELQEDDFKVRLTGTSSLRR